MLVRIQQLHFDYIIYSICLILYFLSCDDKIKNKIASILSACYFNTKGVIKISNTNTGRPNKYYTHIEPRLKEIEKLCVVMNERQIAEFVGVGYTSWKKYKKEFPTFSTTLKKGKAGLVTELKSILIERAKGYRYEDKKVIKENGEVVREEISVKTVLPDVASISMLLKNMDSDNWCDNPKMYELKRQELELKKQHMEQSEW